MDWIFVALQHQPFDTLDLIDLSDRDVALLIVVHVLLLLLRLSVFHFVPFIRLYYVGR